MDKEDLYARLKQLKADVEKIPRGQIEEVIVNICNALLRQSKELFSEKLKDIEEVKTKEYTPGGKMGSQSEIVAKLGQAIAILEEDISGPVGIA